jgi:hypothetical protein
VLQRKKCHGTIVKTSCNLHIDDHGWNVNKNFILQDSDSKGRHMKTIVKVSGSELRLAHLLDGVRLSPHEMASAKARMDQAEAIAHGMAAIGKAVSAAVAWVVHGSQVFARRIKSAFMKPAHH